jgi:riboflavin synthase
MFTGIVEELGTVVGLAGGRLSINGPVVTGDARHGDSIAVNGVCLTVLETADGRFTADVMAETLRRSSLGALRPGDPVNLERAARVGDRLGGHIVQGHVDGVGSVLSRERLVDGDAGPRQRHEQGELVRFSLPAELARYVVEKGSITVDGVSLTVVSVDADSFVVGLIPTTLDLTTLGRKAPGDPVNVEVDVLAKYVEKLVGA